MSYGKQSLFITRFLCLAGLPSIWCIAIINIAFQYINTKNTIALADSIGTNLKFNLNSMLGDNLNIDSQKIAPENFTDLANQMFIVNSGTVVALALLSTALLAIAISIIDMRNMESLKLQDQHPSNKPIYKNHL